MDSHLLFGSEAYIYKFLPLFVFNKNKNFINFKSFLPVQHKDTPTNASSLNTNIKLRQTTREKLNAQNIGHYFLEVLESPCLGLPTAKKCISSLNNFLKGYFVINYESIVQICFYKKWALNLINPLIWVFSNKGECWILDNQCIKRKGLWRSGNSEWNFVFVLRLYGLFLWGFVRIWKKIKTKILFFYIPFFKASFNFLWI